MTEMLKCNYKLLKKRYFQVKLKSGKSTTSQQSLRSGLKPNPPTRTKHPRPLRLPQLRRNQRLCTPQPRRPRKSSKCRRCRLSVTAWNASFAALFSRKRPRMPRTLSFIVRKRLNRNRDVVKCVIVILRSIATFGPFEALL